MGPDVNRQDRDYKLIKCCADRIVDLATEIEWAWEIGIPHGDHREPWTSDFQHVAVEIYIATVPGPYALKVGETFEECARKMSLTRCPADAEENWRIVVSYLRSRADCIFQQLGRRTNEAIADSGLLRASTPGVVRYDKLAPLLHPEGVRRLRKAAKNVAQAPLPTLVPGPHLTCEEVEWVQALVDGEAVVDLAHRYGHSRRSMFRLLSELWEKMGVDGRVSGLIRASELDLLKPLA